MVFNIKQVLPELPQHILWIPPILQLNNYMYQTKYLEKFGFQFYKPMWYPSEKPFYGAYSLFILSKYPSFLFEMCSNSQPIANILDEDRRESQSFVKSIVITVYPESNDQSNDSKSMILIKQKQHLINVMYMAEKANIPLLIICLTIEEPYPTLSTIAEIQTNNVLFFSYHPDTLINAERDLSNFLAL